MVAKTMNLSTKSKVFGVGGRCEWAFNNMFKKSKKNVDW